MKIFGRKIILVKNGINANNTVSFFSGINSFGGESVDFAKSDLYDCFKKISDRLGNMVFSAKVDFLTTKQIFNFLLENRLKIIIKLFFDGYVVVDCDKLDFSTRKQMFKSGEKVTFDLQPNEVVFISETLSSTGNTDYSYISDKVGFLNVINSSDYNLIKNYGAMGIISPEQTSDKINESVFDNDEIAAMQEAYRKSYGVTFGKWSLMFVPRSLKYSKIDLPISQLQLSEKRLYLLQALFSYLGIPKEISVYFENSKYANRNEAELDFYSNTISSYARILVDLATDIYNNKKKNESYLLANEFWFDFVGVLALQEAKLNERKSAQEELAFWKDVKISFPEHSEIADDRINTLIENL